MMKTRNARAGTFPAALLILEGSGKGVENKTETN